MTEIKLYKNIPFDENYQHTLLPSTREQRNTMLNTYTHDTFTDLQYIRREQAIKLNIDYNTALLYNYAEYESDGTITYAFIKNWEYISPTVSKATIKVDALQTYYYDIKVKSAFVEREHSETDAIGSNLVAEGLETGEYIINKEYGNIVTGDTVIVINATVDADGNNIAGTLTDGVFGGSVNTTIAIGAWQEAASYLLKIAEKGKSEAILAVYQRPKQSQYTGTYTRPESIQGYIPRNNKLYTYPYNMLYINNMQGTATAYKWEFTTEKQQIELRLDIEQNITTKGKLVPINYKGSNRNDDEAITATLAVICQYNNDAFVSWFAQSRIDLFLNGFNAVENTIKGIGSGAIAAATSDPNVISSGGYDIFNYARQTMSQVYKQAIQPPQTKGQPQETLNITQGTLGFMIYNKTITKEYAQKIDKYFTMFGYQTNEEKQPNLHSRPNHNYIKAQQTIIESEIPKKYQTEIQNAIARGITIWHNNETYGDYSVDNQI